MTFYGQEKVEYNAQLCLMNMAVHGLTGVIKSGNEANTFYNDAHNLAGCCDYMMAIIWSGTIPPSCAWSRIQAQAPDVLRPDWEMPDRLRLNAA